MENELIYRKARQKVRKKKLFYRHLGVYLIVMAFLFFLNILTTPGFPWFLFPALGWGLGLAFHYFHLFGWPLTGAGTSEWEERQVEKEIQKMSKRYLSTPVVEETDRLELQPQEKRQPERVKLDQAYDNEDLV